MGLGAALVLCLAAISQQTTGIKVVNSDGLVKFSAIDNAQSQPWLEFGSQTNTVFKLPATGIIPAAYGGTGTNNAFIQAGSNQLTSASSSVTNTFGSAYSAIPTVVVGGLNGGTNIYATNVTTTNFVAKSPTASSTSIIQWIAVGAP